jgi:hypothetical protein
MLAKLPVASNFAAMAACMAERIISVFYASAVAVASAKHDLP